MDFLYSLVVYQNVSAIVHSGFLHFVSGNAFEIKYNYIPARLVLTISLLKPAHTIIQWSLLSPA